MLILATLALAAQLDDPIELTGATGSCNAVLSVDLDGDGVLDLAVAPSSAAEAQVHWGLGQGAFAEPVKVPGTGGQVGDLVAGDVDGDGDLDLFAFRYQSNSLFRMVNLGGRQFAPAVVETDLVHRPTSLCGGDVDGDGDVDLVVTSFETGVRLFPNVGGTLGAPITIGAGVEATHATLGDVDGDGDLDVVVGGYQYPNSSFHWLENPGAAGSWTTSDIATGLDGPPQVELSDLDGDGDLDLVGTLELGGTMVLHENQGGGSFGTQVVLDGAADRVNHLAAADVDGDGLPDVLAAQTDDVSWYRNLGGLVFAAGVAIEENPYCRAFTVDDVDGDGDPDLVAAPDQPGLRWHENDGSGGVGSTQPLSWSAASIRGALVHDIEGDGDLDVLSVSLEDDRVALYENAGGGVFRTQETLTTESDGAFRMGAGDLDGDGLVDLVVSAWYDNSVSWYRRTASGDYESGRVIRAQRADGLDIADMDGDGDLDVALADDQIVWYANDGAGDFGAPQLLDQFGRNPLKLIARDLEGDGDTDVLVVKQNSPYVFAYEGLGGGAFAAGQVQTGYLDFPYDLEVADIDGDGALDMLVAQGASIQWHRNVGGVTYAFGGSLASGFSGRLAPIDIDADGDRDLIAVGFFDPSRWYENVGGSLVDRGELGVIPTYAMRAAVGDLDSDGDEDLVVGYSGKGTLYMFPNSTFGEVGQSYCGPAVVGSSGAPAVLSAAGSGSALSETLVLTGRHLPRNAFGMFFTGRSQGSVVPAGSIGRLCMSGAIGRFNGPGQIKNSGEAGVIALEVNPGALPTPNASIPAMAGETWNFQLWFRDVSGGPTSNFTQGVAVTWN